MALIQHIFRLDGTTDGELAALAAELRTSEADVVRRAIRELAQRQLPRPAKTILEKNEKVP
jgi:predicted transcriptional regulator